LRFTRTRTGADVVALPFVSNARAVTEYTPWVVGRHGAEYPSPGELSVPIRVLPTKNSTLAMPSASAADAITVTVAPATTVLPSAGDVMLTVGAALTGADCTETVTGADVVVAPSSSTATAVNVCEPAVASQVIANGAAVSPLRASVCQAVSVQRQPPHPAGA